MMAFIFCTVDLGMGVDFLVAAAEQQARVRSMSEEADCVSAAALLPLLV